MLSYSIAIRTLGTGGDKFRRELESIARQTVKPDKVMIYIGEGCQIPAYTVGNETYMHVKRGMAAQRLLPYEEIDSDVIFFLDDDVELEPESAEKMLKAMEEHVADCIGADSFKNHLMPFKTKLWAAFSNLVLPHRSSKWAFKIHRNGSFSYNSNPTRGFYLSQTCGGPAFMLKKSVYKQLHLDDELWLDKTGLAYGEDFVQTYKIYRNGYRIGILYNAGCTHLDGRTGSEKVRQSGRRILLRSKALLVNWYRAVYSPCATKWERLKTMSAAVIKFVWLMLLHLGMAVATLRPSVATQYIKGIKEGWRYVHSEEFKALRPYVLPKQ